MYLNKLGGYLASSLFFFIASLAQAQSPSVYSAFGVGQMRGAPFVNNIGLGGGGQAYFTPVYMNNVNPAIPAFNELTSFEASVYGENKNYRDASGISSTGGGNLGYLSLGMPFIPGKWTTVVNLTSYSHVKYNNVIEIEDPDLITPTEKSFTGQGGISRVGISTGYRITRNLSLGVAAHYNFGEINRSEFTKLGSYVVAGDTINPQYRTFLEERTSYADFSFSSGLLYRQRLKDNNYINFGATYALGSDVGATRSSQLRKINPANGSIISVGVDTTGINVVEPETRGATYIPARLGLGIAYGKTNKFVVSADAYYQDWVAFRDFGASSGFLGESFSFHLGGEITPDYSSIDNYFQRSVYRIGFRYEQTPFIINDRRINDFGINFGASFPLRMLSTLNVAFELGQMGVNATGLIAENYFRIHLGFTINDRWFVRQKFD